MNLIHEYYYGKADTKIFCRRDIPYKSRGIVVIAHGFMEHSGRYIDFAKELVAHNIGVCIIDHRGNGLSGGTKGDIEDFFDFVEDLRAVVTVLRAKYKKPVMTFGHSMGGLITFIYGIKYKEEVCGQIFSSPALGVPLGCKNLPPAFYESMGHVAGELKLHRVGESMATRNQNFVEVFKKDQLSNEFATIRFMDQFLRIGVEYAIKHASEYGHDALFLLGDQDKVIPINRNRELLKQISPERITVKEYKGCMHDLLHDLDEEVVKVEEDIVVWTLEHFKKCE
ncbi:MAG: lysophospholipase [Cellulosilyticaceae bacterium]